MCVCVFVCVYVCMYVRMYLSLLTCDWWKAISTLVSVDGEMYFLDNNMESTGGGALYLSNAQVMVSSGSALIFESNQGR